MRAGTARRLIRNVQKGRGHLDTAKTKVDQVIRAANRMKYASKGMESFRAKMQFNSAFNDFASSIVKGIEPSYRAHVELMIERYRQANPTPGFFKKYLMRQEIREELLRKNEKRWQRLTLAARELSPMELKTRLIEMVDSDIAVAEDMIKKLKEKI